MSAQPTARDSAARATSSTAATRIRVADPASRRDQLDAGLAIAARTGGLTVIAMAAPVVPAATIVGAWPDAPAVAWSTRELVLAGVGVAAELRGRGDTRWAQLVAGAHGFAAGREGTLASSGAEGRCGSIAHEVHAVIAGVASPLSALGVARPRFIGGAAFATGAADHAPWIGFGDAWFVLPRWTYVAEPGRRDAGAWLVLAIDAADGSAGWHDELAVFEAAFVAARAGAPEIAPTEVLDIDRGDTIAWRAHVAAITAAIANGECAKIVAARSCVVSVAREPRSADLLYALDERHADCARLLVRPPGGATLVAATPERLVRRDGDVVSCDALAGTISRDAGDASAATLLASAKDRNEHELVVRAIAGALREVSAEVSMPAEPGVRALRHVLHLHTPIRATLARPCHVLELAARLHPTPAVGGTPTAVACAWIAEREPVSRGWYASPVGWFDLDGNGELAVAIRSGVVAGDRVHLWAGAGIVAGSDPDRELAETDIKLRAILGALGVGG